jgi:pyridoxal/pyridoxine/pyridoxamine kinase
MFLVNTFIEWLNWKDKGRSQQDNFTGYPVWRGQILNGEELWNLIEGLEANDLLFYTHLLTGFTSYQWIIEKLHVFGFNKVESEAYFCSLHVTAIGYIRSASFLECILQVVQKLRSVNPNLIYGIFYPWLCFMCVLCIYCQYHRVHFYKFQKTRNWLWSF